MTDIDLSDLTEEATQAAEDAASNTQSTGEWAVDLVETLDKRGLLEPIMFGKDRLPDAEAAPDPTPTNTDGVDLSADTIAQAGRGVMDQLGADVTVAELVEICENNPQLVNSKLDELGGEPEPEPQSDD